MAKKPEPMFGDDYDMKFDCIVNHEAYSFLRVSVEVPRDQNKELVVLLNGREVGRLEAIRNMRKRVTGFKAFRFGKPNDPSRQTPVGDAPFPEMGRACAAIISDFVLCP